MKIKGNNQWRNLEYDIPEWSNDGMEEDCFIYKGEKYFLSEFLTINLNQQFDGYRSDSFWSGILIKLSKDGEQVKVFTYYN